MKKNTTKKALASLAIAGMTMSMIPFNVLADTGITTARLSGSDRVGTAIAAANAGWTTADTAILAPSADANLVDALAAAPLAGKTAPILLTDNNNLTEATKAELLKLGVRNVYVVGAINQTVVDQVNALSGVTAIVLKGADRIATAAAISAKLRAPAGSFVVGYGALADALSVASYAAAHNYSILVANPDGSLPASEAAYTGSQVYIIGGPTLVADIPGATRLYGADRFATNQAILNALNYSYNNVYLANGADAHLVDSLVASSLAAESSSPIVLTNTDGVNAATTSSVQNKLTANSVVTALGGNSVVPDAVVTQLINGITAHSVPSSVNGPVTINSLTISGQLVGSGALNSPAVALISNGVTVSTVANGASAANASITYLVTTSNNITAKDANGNTLVATTLNSPIIIGNDTFKASYTVPSDANGNVSAVFNSTASSQETFNIVVQAPFSNNGQPVRSNEASIEWGVPGSTVLSPIYSASNPKGLGFSTPGNMQGLVPVVATILPATGSTTAVSGQPIKFRMTQTSGTSDANAYFTDSTGIPMVAAGAVVGNGGSSSSAIYVVNTDKNGQALAYVNSNMPTTNDIANPGAAMNISLSAQPVNGGGSTNTGYYQWRAVSQAAKIANVSPSAMLNPTGVTSGTTVVANNAETATSGTQMTISGTLQDAAGNPVSNANVAIQDYDVINGFSNNVQNDAYVVNGVTTLFSAINYPMVTTDSNGNFSVTVTANVPVTQSVSDSVTRYYAYYVPPTIAISTGQSLPTNVTALSFVGNSNSGDFINLVWQQGQSIQSVGASHTSLMPNYNTLSAVPQTYSFTNVVGSDQLIYAAAYNQNGMIVAPASGNQFDGYALTYDIIAPSGMYFDSLGSEALPTDLTHGGIGEMKVQYTQNGGFVINALYYTDTTLCYSNGTLATATTGPAGFDPTAYGSAYDGSGQINFYIQSNKTSAVIASGTAGSVNINVSAYSNSATTIDTNHAQGSAAGIVNAAFTAGNSIGSLGLASDLSDFYQYYPLLAGNAPPPSTISVSGISIPANNIYDPSSNASFIAAPFNSYPAISTIPTQGLTMNFSLTERGVISNIDGYTLAAMPSNVTVNVNRSGEVSANNVKLWVAQSGYQVVGYLPGSTSGSVTLIEQNLSTPTSFIGVSVTGVNSAGTQVATWTLPASSLPGNFEGFLGFNVNTSGQLQPMVASFYKNNGNSYAPYSSEGATITAGIYLPVEAIKVYTSDKYSESPVVTVTNSLNSHTATVNTSFSASSLGGLVAVRANPINVNCVLGSTKDITLTAEDSYGNPIAYQTIYLGTGIPGLWLTQVNNTAITGSVNMGTTSSVSMQTETTPVPLFTASTPPAYDNASISGITAYNLKSAPVIALRTGSDGTVTITLADGNVLYIADTASPTTSNSYVADQGTAISNQRISFYGDNSLSRQLGSVLANWSGGSTNVAVTGISLNQSALSLTAGGATAALAASVAPSNATNQTVTWTSSDTSVATVSGGVVTPVAAGTATITATTQDGNKTTACTVTVAPANVAVTDVTLNQTVLALTAGGAASTLVASVTPSNATNQMVTWSSSDTSVATVSGGVITPVAAGITTITATTQDSSKTAACTVTVAPANVAVTGVTLNQTTLALTAGGAVGSLTASVIPSKATNQTVTWSSSNQSVATVTNGVVTPVAAGTAAITATTQDGNKTAACTVTVAPANVAVANVTLNQPALALTAGGAAGSLTATVTPSNATDQTVTWSSSDQSVATVNNGAVTPVAAGTATITATTQDGSKTAACAVTVAPANIAVTSVALNHTTLALTAGGSPDTLAASVTPSNATDRTITWSSSNQSVATVANGVVTPVAEGTAIITTTTQDGSKTAACTVTVAPANIAVTGVTLNQTALTLIAGGTKGTLTATVTPSNATNQAVTWTSSDQSVTTVTNGLATPIAAGTATITATTQDGSKTATCTVTVVPKLIVSAAISSSGLLSATTATTVTSLSVYAGTGTTGTTLDSIPVTAGNVSNYQIAGITKGSVYTLLPYVDGVAQAGNAITVTAE